MHFDWTITAGDIVKTVPWAAILIYLWRAVRPWRGLPARVDKVLAMLGDHEQRLERLEGRPPRRVHQAI